MHKFQVLAVISVQIRVVCCAQCSLVHRGTAHMVCCVVLKVDSNISKEHAASSILKM